MKKIPHPKFNEDFSLKAYGKKMNEDFDEYIKNYFYNNLDDNNEQKDTLNESFYLLKNKNINILKKISNNNNKTYNNTINNTNNYSNNNTINDNSYNSTNNDFFLNQNTQTKQKQLSFFSKKNLLLKSVESKKNSFFSMNSYKNHRIANLSRALSTKENNTSNKENFTSVANTPKNASNIKKNNSIFFHKSIDSPFINLLQVHKEKEKINKSHIIYLKKQLKSKENEKNFLKKKFYNLIFNDDENTMKHTLSIDAKLNSLYYITNRIYQKIFNNNNKKDINFFINKSNNKSNKINEDIKNIFYIFKYEQEQSKKAKNITYNLYKSIENDINNIQKNLKEKKEMSIKYYLNILKKGKDTRQKGLIWVVRNLLKLNYEPNINDFPFYFDEHMVKYIIMISKIKNQNKMLLEHLKKLKGEIEIDNNNENNENDENNNQNNKNNNNNNQNDNNQNNNNQNNNNISSLKKNNNSFNNIKKIRKNLKLKLKSEKKIKSKLNKLIQHQKYYYISQDIEKKIKFCLNQGTNINKYKIYSKNLLKNEDNSLTNFLKKRNLKHWKFEKNYLAKKTMVAKTKKFQDLTEIIDIKKKIQFNNLYLEKLRNEEYIYVKSQKSNKFNDNINSNMMLALFGTEMLFNK